MRCPTCGERFGGITAFEIHRIGAFPVANDEHPVPVGEAAKSRRCLTADEMLAKKLHLDGQGKWVRPCDNAKTLRMAQAKNNIVVLEEYRVRRAATIEKRATEQK